MDEIVTHLVEKVASDAEQCNRPSKATAINVVSKHWIEWICSKEVNKGCDLPEAVDL